MATLLVKWSRIQ